jgi:hypothetical protein
MNYDLTVQSVTNKIKQIIKPCFCCGELLDVKIRHEKEKDTPLGWAVTIDCPNCQMQATDMRFIQTIGAVEVELLRLLNN